MRFTESPTEPLPVSLKLAHDGALFPAPPRGHSWWAESHVTRLVTSAYWGRDELATGPRMGCWAHRRLCARAGRAGLVGSAASASAAADAGTRGRRPPPGGSDLRGCGVRHAGCRVGGSALAVGESRPSAGRQGPGGGTGRRD